MNEYERRMNMNTSYILGVWTAGTFTLSAMGTAAALGANPLIAGVSCLVAMMAGAVVLRPS